MDVHINQIGVDSDPLSLVLPLQLNRWIWGRYLISNLGNKNAGYCSFLDFRTANKEAKKRNCLTLKTKIEVIKTHERSINVRELSNYGKTQIAKVLKNKDNLLLAFESNALIRDRRAL